MQGIRLAKSVNTVSTGFALLVHRFSTISSASGSVTCARLNGARARAGRQQHQDLHDYLLCVLRFALPVLELRLDFAARSRQSVARLSAKFGLVSALCRRVASVASAENSAACGSGGLPESSSRMAAALISVPRPSLVA